MVNCRNVKVAVRSFENNAVGENHEYKNENSIAKRKIKFFCLFVSETINKNVFFLN